MQSIYVFGEFENLILFQTYNDKQNKHRRAGKLGNKLAKMLSIKHFHILTKFPELFPKRINIFDE